MSKQIKLRLPLKNEGERYEKNVVTTEICAKVIGFCDRDFFVKKP